MNPEESTEGFDLSDLEPKAEIGEGLDLEADEAYADRENLLTTKKLFNTYADEGATARMRQFLNIASSWEKLINDEEKHKWSQE